MTAVAKSTSRLASFGEEIPIFLLSYFYYRLGDLPRQSIDRKDALSLADANENARYRILRNISLRGKFKKINNESY